MGFEADLMADAETEAEYARLSGTERRNMSEIAEEAEAQHAEAIADGLVTDLQRRSLTNVKEALAKAPKDVASNCTIELSHGGYVHVPYSPQEVRRLAVEAVERGDLFVDLNRLEGDPGGRQARGMLTFTVNPRNIVGIFPLVSQSNR